MAHPWRKLERNKEIYFKYAVLNYTMNDLAKEYGVCYQRVQQIVRNVEHHVHAHNPDYSNLPFPKF